MLTFFLAFYFRAEHATLLAFNFLHPFLLLIHNFPLILVYSLKASMVSSFLYKASRLTLAAC